MTFPFSGKMKLNVLCSLLDRATCVASFHLTHTHTHTHTHRTAAGRSFKNVKEHKIVH